MNRAKSLLVAAGVSAGECIMLHKPANMLYVSGYTGEGLILLAEGFTAIITDFRYTEQAGRQAPGFTPYQIEMGITHVQLAYKLICERNLTKLRFEDDYVTVKDMHAITEAMPGVDLTPLNRIPEKLRRIKDDSELTFIEKACDISCKAFDYICDYIKPGLTERQIRLALDYKMLEFGADELAFATIVASGENGSLPHAIPGERMIKKGDMITLDFGAKLGGYCADMTRTIAVGEPEKRMLEIYDLVLTAQKAAQEALAPGKVCSEIDTIARNIIYNAGFRGFFGHGLGHCVGIDIHEDPRLSMTCSDTLEVGNVITVEPGIYLPGIGGVRIENTCVITLAGGKSLVHAPRELRVL